jgi:ParB-like nuclease domain
VTTAAPLEIQTWPIDRLVLYARNPRKNDAVVDRMCSSIREFGFKIPVLARSDGEVVDGHLRIKAARKLGIDEIPVILCDEWSPAQVKAFRLLVNRSVTWASWDEELLALELQELSEADFDLDLTGFNPGEIDGLLALPDEERANATPRVPENPVSLPGDLWLCGPHRVLCGDATNPESVARLLGDWQPILMVTDQPYGIELDSEWRDRAGLNGGDFGSKRTLYDEGQKLALDHNTCIQILRDAGHIDPASASCLLDFGHLNAAELEMYLREHGVSSVLDV